MEWPALLDARFIASVTESRRDHWIPACWAGWLYYTGAPVLVM